MHYHISILDTVNHFIKLTWTIENIHQDILHIQLPAWRPGRYELQHFAKNVRNFSISDEHGNTVPFHKIVKDKWEVQTHDIHTLIVSYEYYANQLDAGASFVSEEFLYINPVNCFMYVEGRMDEEYTLHFDLPKDYNIACQLPVSGHSMQAKNFDLLADSPLIASNTLQHYSFDVSANTKGFETSTIHFWFQGTPYSDMPKMIAETKQYCNEQVAVFGDLPCRDYHFLYHILPAPFRHGVEHLHSTVIAMGPAEDWNKAEFYDSFMAISSHELFHLWNIKRIRPVDMLPYDFTKENYSTLGYVYEGITTYYGDIMLLRSGAWSWEQYTESLKGDLLKHLLNPGRFNYSVAESSFDTWLDGYVPGVYGRKVSIYTEGMLAAFIADILIINQSEGAFSLNNVLFDLYNEYYKHDKGYTENDYKQLLEKYGKGSFDNYFKELIWGKGQYQHWLSEITYLIGCTINFESGELTKNQVFTESQSVNFNKWVQSKVAAQL
ncbi:MAG: M61 family peptidase [Bacteroidota bacterium]